MEGKENETGVSPGQGVSEGRGSGKALLSLNRTLERLVPLANLQGDPRSAGPGERDLAGPADTEGGALRLGRGGGESPRALPSIPGSRLGGGPGSADFP